jgi:hypothetical protein
MRWTLLAVFCVTPAVAQEHHCAAWIGHVDYLNWQARSAAWQTTFALRQDYPNRTYIYHAPSVDIDRGSGVRVGLGRRFANQWEITWNYTSFSMETYDQLPVPTGQSDINIRDVRIGLDYDVHDLEIGRSFFVDQSLSMRLFGGFRWGMIDTRYRTTFFNAAGEHWNQDTTDLDAYGLRFGGEARWHFGSLSLFGGGALSALAGRSLDQLTERGSNTTIYPRKFNRAVPGIETTAGCSWQYECLELTGGYEFNYFGGVVPEHAHRDPQLPRNDLLLDGFFLRLAFDY